MTTIHHDREVAERFDALVSRFKREVSDADPRLAAVLRNLPLGDRLTILDLGCGKGRFARHLQRSGARVIGLDLSALMLDEARGLSRIKATARRLPFADGTFDAVIAIETLEHIGDVARVLHEARRVLRPGGRIIIIDKNAWSLDAKRPWLPSLFLKWIDERRGRWMYPAGGPVKERWFSPKALQGLLRTPFVAVATEYLLSEREQRHRIFRRFPSTRLMVCWTAIAPGGGS